VCETIPSRNAKYCGAHKGIEMKGSRLVPNSLRALILLFLIPSILCCIFYVADFFDGTTHTYTTYTYGWLEKTIVVETIVWADDAIAVTVILAAVYIFYLVIPLIVYDDAKRHGRNPVRWTTAFVVFTPLLAGIAYLLTWPKSKQ
jgi:hypothetical protein